MSSRLLDAHAEVRVRFVENGQAIEFVAQAEASRYLPMVINYERDNAMSPNPPGGKITLESRASIFVERRRVEKLPSDIHGTIDRWIATKRRELEDLAAKKVAGGAKTIRINERGEMRRV